MFEKCFIKQIVQLKRYDLSVMFQMIAFLRVSKQWFCILGNIFKVAKLTLDAPQTRLWPCKLCTQKV